MHKNRLSTTTALSLALVMVLPAAMALDPPASPTQMIFGQPCGTLTGVVAEENGARIPGVTVLALPFAHPNAALLVYDGDEADDEGRYTLQLREGNWQIVALAISEDSEPQALYGIANESVTVTRQGTTCVANPQTVDFQLPPLAAVGNDARGILELTLVEDVDGDNAVDNVSAPMAGYPVTIWNTCENTASGQTGLRVATGTTNATGHLRLVLPTTTGVGVCVQVDIGRDFIDTGAGGDRDGEFFAQAAVAITEGETAKVQYNFTKKLRHVTISTEDNDVPDRLIGGAEVTIHHPVYCPGGVKPVGINDRYDCGATTAAESTSDGLAGQIVVTLPIDGNADHGTPFQFHAVHPHFFPKTDPCDVTNSPSPNSPGNTPATQNDLECEVDMGHVSKLLSGRVVDPDGQPVSGAVLEIDAALDLDDETVVTDPNGEFVVPVRSDDYTITIAGSNFCATVDGSGDVELGDLVLGGSESTVTGAALDPIDSSSVDDFPVRFRNETTGHTCHTRTLADGTFGLSVPDDANYTVIIGDDVDLSISFKDTRTAIDFIDATGAPSNVDTNLGTFELERRDGQLFVTAWADENPDVTVAAADITCRNVFTGASFDKATDDAGVARFRVPFGPGYECMASHPTDGLVDTGFMPADEVVEDDYDSENPDDETKLNLLMERHLFTISGQVTDAANETGIAGITVAGSNTQCAAVSGDDCLQTVVTDEGGNYTLRLPYVGQVVEIFDGGQHDPDNDFNGNGNLVQAGTRVNPVTLAFTSADHVPVIISGLIGPDATAQMRPAADQTMVFTGLGGDNGGGGLPGGVPSDLLPGDVDADGDGIPDELEPTYCSTVGSALGGQCTNDDFVPDENYPLPG